jgi:hypothetical protein
VTIWQTLEHMSLFCLLLCYIVFSQDEVWQICIIHHHNNNDDGIIRYITSNRYVKWGYWHTPPLIFFFQCDNIPFANTKINTKIKYTIL